MDTNVAQFMGQLRNLGQKSLFERNLEALTDEERQELKRIYLETSSELQLVENIFDNVHERLNSDKESSKKLTEQIRDTFDHLPAPKQCTIVNTYSRIVESSGEKWTTYPIDYFNEFCQKEMGGDIVHVCKCLQDDFNDIDARFFMVEENREEIFLNNDIWQSIDDEFDFLEYLVKHQEVLKD